MTGKRNLAASAEKYLRITSKCLKITYIIAFALIVLTSGISRFAVCAALRACSSGVLGQAQHAGPQWPFLHLCFLLGQLCLGAASPPAQCSHLGCGAPSWHRCQALPSEHSTSTSPHLTPAISPFPVSTPQARRPLSTAVLFLLWCCVR